MVKKLVIASLLLLSLVGCGYYEGVVQPTPRSYLAFNGNTAGVVVVVDQNITLNLDKELQTKEGGQGPVLFQIAPGKHTIRATRAGQEIVNRIVIIADGATQEILIP
jgi:Mg-chelatase subunit ChlD